MTLIAAFRCFDGAVVCADSQETYGDYRVTVNKIKPRHAGSYELVIGGAGNTAALIDGLADAVERSVQNWPPSLTEEDARLRLERVLLSYHVRQVRHYPADDDQKLLRFIVCVRDKTAPNAYLPSNVYLWRTDGTTAERVETYALLGWEEAAYEYEVRRLYTHNIMVASAILLGIYLFMVARNSLYISGGTQLITIKSDGTWARNQYDVSLIEERMKLCEEQLAGIQLLSLNEGLNDTQFIENLGHYIESIVSFRRGYFSQGQAQTSTLEDAIAYAAYIDDPHRDPNPLRLGELMTVYFSDKESRMALQSVVRERQKLIRRNTSAETE